MQADKQVMQDVVQRLYTELDTLQMQKDRLDSDMDSLQSRSVELSSLQLAVAIAMCIQATY